MAGRDKFKDTIITDAGRHLLISIGGGEGKITYTKAEAYGQDVSGMADEDIRRLTTLSEMRLSTPVRVSDIEDNTITGTADFNNKDLTDDVNFNSVAWFAKIDADDAKYNIRANQEYLLAITPANGMQTLAAAPPDHRSSQSISINLNMAISNAARVDMTVNEAGIVHFGELDLQLTKVKDDIDKKLANYYTKREVDDKFSNLDISRQIAGKADQSNVNAQVQDAKNSATQLFNTLNDRLNSKTTITITTGYNWNAVTLTNELRPITNAWLVDQQILAGALTRMNNIQNDINSIRYASQERRSLGASDDANNIIDDGIYRIGEQPIKNGNGCTWCFLIVRYLDNNIIHQFIDCGTDGLFVRNISKIWSSYPSWTKIVTQDQLDSLTRVQNDHENRIKQLEQRPYFEVKVFPSSQEAQARAWENGRLGYRMAVIQG